MINPQEAAGYIRDAIPGNRTTGDQDHDTLYGAVRSLYECTDHELSMHRYAQARQCFRLAEKLYVRGNEAVRNALENIYVFSLSALLSRHPGDQGLIMSMIPVTIYSLYMRQCCHPGS